MQRAQSGKLFVWLYNWGLTGWTFACWAGVHTCVLKYWLSRSTPPTNWTVSWLSPKLNLSIMSLNGNFKCNDVIFDDYTFTHARPRIQYTNIYIDWLRNYFCLPETVCLSLLVSSDNWTDFASRLLSFDAAGSWSGWSLDSDAELPMSSPVPSITN